MIIKPHRVSLACSHRRRMHTSFVLFSKVLHFVLLNCMNASLQRPIFLARSFGKMKEPDDDRRSVLNFLFSIPFDSVDGGVSKNDFICQLLADLTKLKVERAVDSELSALGVGFLAGLNVGIWKSRADLINLRQIDRIFEPNQAKYETCVAKMKSWERAVSRFTGWYNN